MTRDELIEATRTLVDEGVRLERAPSMIALRDWLARSDALLAAAWGSMDRYHLTWLMVGKPQDVVRGRPMAPDEEDAYVAEVARQKTAALRMSLDAVGRQGMPFVGELGGVAPGQGMGTVPGATAAAGSGAEAGPAPTTTPAPTRGRFGLPLEADDLAERVRLAREEAARHAADDHRPRAPRPERMQR